jgi:hypothetical protein
LVTGAAARRRAAASGYCLRRGRELEGEGEGEGKRAPEHQRLTLSTAVRSVRPEGVRRRRISSRKRRPEAEKNGDGGESSASRADSFEEEGYSSAENPLVASESRNEARSFLYAAAMAAADSAKLQKRGRERTGKVRGGRGREKGRESLSPSRAAGRRHESPRRSTASAAARSSFQLEKKTEANFRKTP